MNRLLYRAIHDDKFWRIPALVGLAVIVVVLIVGCATTESYWVKTRPAVQVKQIVYVNNPCGRPINGCYNRNTRIIELQRGMVLAKHDCVLAHEKKHADGYEHPNERTNYAVDCGDGEMYSEGPQ